MIIAEIGHNHDGDMEVAKELIHQAHLCGADVVKFQLYDTVRIVPSTHKWYWDLERSQLSQSQWFDLVTECNRCGIEFMASPFDVERVKWCQEVNMRRYKVASRSIYDEALLEAIMKTNMDVIISLGKVSDRGIPKLDKHTHVDYLYCVAKYPAALEDLHLGKVNFRMYSGLSDHTQGIEAAMVAIARGANIIEKHFTLSRQREGCDHICSMEPSDLRQLVLFSRKVREMA